MVRTSSLVGMALLWLAAGCATTTTPVAAPAGDAARVAAALGKLVAAPQLAGGRVGAIVVDAGSGATLAAHGADLGYATASNMKVVSAAVALAALGPTATTRTELSLFGVVAGGELRGELVLRGGGDPTFGEDDGRALAAFAAAVRQRGIQRVVGRVRGDGSWQGDETLGLGWQWDYLEADYAAPFGGLCCAGNVVTLTVAPGAEGRPTVVADLPSVALVAEVEQVAAGQETALTVQRPLGSMVVRVRGRIAADAKPRALRVAVADPAAAAAERLTVALQQAGVELVAAEVPESAAEEVLATHVSPPLASIVVPLLRDSNNLYAEQVWRWAARLRTGDGSTAAAERHAKAVLAELGVPTDGMVLADGSGLSRRNLVQPRQLAALLVAAQRSPWRDAFVAGLPVAGRSGTLRNRFADGPANGRVAAKTGYIARVAGLSGYVPRADPNAPPLVFSLLLNDYTCANGEARAAMDAFVQELAAIAGS